MMTGQIVEIFQPFQIGLPEEKRYWEDDATGLSIKKGQLVTVSQRQFRSNDLKLALMRNYVLIKEGQATFAFKNNIIRVTPGESKNLLEVIEGPEKKEKQESVSHEKKVTNKKNIE